MNRFLPLRSLPTLPVAALACIAVFCTYVACTSGYRSLTCERLAPGSVQCEAEVTYVFGLVTRTEARFPLEDVQIDSELQDRDPHGGVRFRHRLTLAGASRRFSPDAFRTPLSGAAITKQIHGFMQGDGPTILTFQQSTQTVALLRSGVLALLLAIVSWGFWDFPVRADPELEEG